MNGLLTSNRIRGIALSLLSATMLGLALPPYTDWWLAWFALVPLLVVVSRERFLWAGLYGWMFGTLVNFIAFHWCLELMQRYSELGVGSWLFMLTMSAYQGLPYGLAAAVLRVGRSPGAERAWGWLWVAAVLTAFEYFYPQLFPWYLANSQHTRPGILAVVEFTGVSGASFLLFGVNAAVAHLLRSRHGWWLKLAGPLSLLALGWLIHLGRAPGLERQIEAAPKMTIGLVQPNFWIDEGESLERLHAYQRMSFDLVQKHPNLDLVVWPESSVLTPPPPFEGGEEGLLDPLSYPLGATRYAQSSLPPAQSLEADRAPRPEKLAPQRGHRTPLLLGVTMKDYSPGAEGPVPGRDPAYNCALMLGPEGAVVGHVAKVELMMFGETVPLAGLFPQVYRLLPMASALMAGPGPGVIRWGEATMGIMICYEDLLPRFHRELAQQRPNLLVNLTNDAWFGRTGEAEAHLALAKMRAIEGRSYLVRATSTGVSAVVDPYGRELVRIAQDRRGTAVQEVALLEVTTLYERLGNWFAWLCLLLGGWVLYRERAASSEP